MNDINKEALRLCDEILKYVPEFKDYEEFPIWEDNGKENPYMHFGSFGRFLVNKIENDLNNDPIVDRSFEFINEIYNNSDHSIKTMLSTEIFENLSISKKVIKVSQEKLKNDALKDFLNILKNSA